MADTEQRSAPPNPSAFPHPGVCGGMSLRDYFAGQAVADAMRAVAFQQIVPIDGEQPQDTVARVAYEVADAMLLARAKR